MSDRLTLATAEGLPLLSLVLHVGTGLIAMAAGFLAIAVRKGGKWHRWSGLVFVGAMITTGMTAAGIAIYEGKPIVIGGTMTAYLVFTAWTAVKPLAWVTRGIQIALAALALCAAAAEYAIGVTALGRPGRNIDGVPAGMMLFMATIFLLAGIGDVRMIRAGGIQGARRVARHLWRMSFGLFIASGSFLLGQMQFIPRPIRVVPVIFALALSPLAFLLYWMWRVRLKQNLRGLALATAARPHPSPGTRAPSRAPR